MANTRTEDASEVLREALRRMSQAGITYTQIARSADPSLGWNANAIKQLVSRPSKIRRTTKISGLVKAIELVKSNFSPDQDKSIAVGTLLERAKFEFVTVDHEAESKSLIISEFSKERSMALQRAGANYSLPERLYYFRMGIALDRVIIAQIDTSRTESGHSFSIKQLGQDRKKRIVLGTVHFAQTVTFLLGMSYDLSARIEDNDFISADFMDLEANLENLVQSEVGPENILVNNRDLRGPSFVGSYLGIDGAGLPISGKALFLTEQEYAAFGLSALPIGSVHRSALPRQLSSMIEIYGLSTISDKPRSSTF